MPPYLVKLTYFKQSGKYYSEGEYYSKEEDMWRIFDEVRRLLQNKVLPGLIEGHSNFIVYVEVPDHRHNYPTLVIENE